MLENLNRKDNEDSSEVEKESTFALSCLGVQLVFIIVVFGVIFISTTKNRESDDVVQTSSVDAENDRMQGESEKTDSDGIDSVTICGASAE